MYITAPEGFTWTRRKSGDIVLTHHGRQAATLRGQRAEEFLSGLSDDVGDGQELMARFTGNYKRGNERAGRSHPRNRPRR